MSETGNNQPIMFNSESLDAKLSRILTLQEMEHESHVIFRKENAKQLDSLIERMDVQGGKISKNMQTTEFLLKYRDESVIKLDSINAKLDYTNGAIAQAKKDIFELQEKMKKQEDQDAAVNEIITCKDFVVKWCLNRYILIASMIFVIGLFKVFSNPELRDLLAKVVGI